MPDPFQQWRQERFQQIGAAATRMGGDVGAAFQFLTQSITQAASSAADFERKLSEVARKVAEHAREMSRAFQGLAETLTRGVHVALGLVTGTLGGFVSAGLHASSVGEVLSFQFERLTRSIAGLFRPEIEKLISLVQKLHDWLAQLSDKQREQIARWAQAAAVGLTVAAVLPRILQGVVALTRGIQALAAATTFAEIATGIGAILPLIGLAAGAITALVVGTEKGRGALSGLAEAFAPLAEAGKAIWAALQPLIEALGAVLGPVVRAVAISFQFMAAVVQVVLAAMSPLLGVITVIAKVFGAVADLVTRFVGAVASMATQVGAAFGEVASAIGEVFSALGDVGAALVESLGPVIDVVIELGKAIVQWVVGALKTVAGLIRDVAQGLRGLFGVQKKEAAAEGGRTELPPRGGGLTGLSELYNRLALSSATVTLGGGKTEAEKQTEIQERIAASTAATARAVGGIRPTTVGV